MRATVSRQELEDEGYQISPVQRIYGKSGICYTAPYDGSILYSSTDTRYVFFDLKGKLVLIIEEEDIEALEYDLEQRHGSFPI